MSKKAEKPLTFKEAVESTEEVNKCYQSGLKALGKYSVKVALQDTTKCEGSIDIDEGVTQKYPNDNRWDYAFSYKSEVFFVEVHSANTGEVSVVLKKLQWLKDWLVRSAPEINKMKAKNQTPFFWVQSGNFNIPNNSAQFRIAATKGIKPIPKLILSY